jgi:hypothetical protein
MLKGAQEEAEESSTVELYLSSIPCPYKPKNKSPFFKTRTSPYLLLFFY